MMQDNRGTGSAKPARLTLIRSDSGSSVTRFIKANQLRFCVQERGRASDPAIVLISGLACQLTMWPESLLEGLRREGFRVICFDNRDIGLSDKVHSRRLINTRLAFVKAQSKLPSAANYTLADMATDTSELVRLLGLRKVHLVGMDMGGGIAQIMAALHAGQVASLTIIGSSSNDPQLPIPDIKLLRIINQSAPPAHREEAIVRYWLSFWQTVQSPAYPPDSAALQKQIISNYRRSYCPEGALRQLQAIIATGSLRRLLPKIQCPTLILHGEKDIFVHPVGGRDIQRFVRGSRLRVLIGVGHDLPEAVCPEIVALITENANYGKSD
jgi:pimeloyl-ACP methyl ester carboxylesterase